MHMFRACLMVAGLGLIATCSGPAPTDRAHIAVATNFKPVMDELEAAFEADAGDVLTVSAGSTGKIFAQIRHGAPVDVFLSADQARPSLLEDGAEAVAGSRMTYAIGQLVLWRKSEGSVEPGALAAPNLGRVAIANPELAPYGRAAMETLAVLGLAETLADKRVLGENVGQAFAFVETGNAEFGFVALSQVLALPAGATGAYWTVPGEHYQPIRQDAVLLKRGADKPVARGFMAFLKSDEAREIIGAAGYVLP